MQIRRLISHLGAAAAGGTLVLLALAVGPSLTPSSSPPSPSLGPSFVEGAAVGRVDAPLRIEIWADFQCPFCRLLSHGIEPELVRTYAVPGRARIIYRDFAFLGQESVNAAVAARCADRQGAFWRYHDLLFASQQGENQGGFRREILLGLARFASLDMVAFEGCLADPTVAAAVAAETEEGRRLGVDSTPTIRLVGPAGSELLRGISSFEAIAAAVERVAHPEASGTPSTAPSGSARSGGSSPSP